MCSSDACYQVDLHTTPESRQQGLMNVVNLEEDRGALFIFDSEDKHAFWMKNMNFSLDIIWINKDLKVTDIKRNALPCTDNCEIYSPKEKALYVLEVNANSDIQIGDILKLK